MEYYILGSIGRHTNEEKATQLATMLHPKATIINHYPNQEWYDNNIKKTDILIYDDFSDICESVSKDDQLEVYTYLYNKNILLKFDKSPQFNSHNIKTLCFGISNNFPIVLDVLYAALMEKSAIEKQKKSTSLRLAQSNGTHIGAKKGSRVVRKKTVAMKRRILNQSIDFNGTMKDIDLLKELGIARNSFYKYKRELKAEYKEK